MWQLEQVTTAPEPADTLRSPWMVASMGLPEGSVPCWYMASPRRIASSADSPAGGRDVLSAAWSGALKNNSGRMIKGTMRINMKLLRTIKKYEIPAQA